MAVRVTSWLLTVALVVLGGLPTLAFAQAGGGPQPDSAYARILAQQGWKAIARQDVDLAGDGQVETVLLSIGTDCGSCHAKLLSVFSGTSDLADVSLDDPDVHIVPGGGIDVSQPVRLPDEPLCCPTAHYTMHFDFDSDAQTLAPDDAVTVGGGGPRAAVATYYQLLNGHWLTQAYGLLSSNFQQQVSLDDWAQGGQAVQSVDAVQVDDLPGRAGNVRVRVQQATQAPNGSTSQSAYTGTWSTVLEDGAWHLDHLSVSGG